MKKNKNKGFTLAEIIIAMTIIGIIAAITIPALLVSANEKAMEAQRKALQARMAQTISQIDDLRVYGKTKGSDDDSSSLNFIIKALKKVYRISRTCDDSTLVKNCDFPDEITTPSGVFKINENVMLTTYIDNATNGTAEKLGGLDTKVAGFKTTNGESIALYYNPNCHGTTTNGFYGGSAITAMCLNMIYDLNGRDNAPNEVGKDIGFMTVFFPKDPDVIVPFIANSDVSSTAQAFSSGYEEANEACKNLNKSLIIPNWKEGMSIAINKKLSNIAASGVYLVSGAGKINGGYKTNVGTLMSETSENWSDSYLLRCVYNN